MEGAQNIMAGFIDDSFDSVSLPVQFFRSCLSRLSVLESDLEGVEVPVFWEDGTVCPQVVWTLQTCACQTHGSMAAKNDHTVSFL